MLPQGGGVQCWGYQFEGATGATGQLIPISTPNPITVTKTGGAALTLNKLRSSARHNCGIDASNGVWCWGQNDAGQGGQTPSGGFAIAAQVPNLSATDVAVGEHASCAVTMNKEVVCWGDDTYGQLGDGAKQANATPQTVKGPNGVGTLGNVTSVALGYGFACALTTDKSVYCWGHNDRGQLGDGTTTDRQYPVRVLLP
jgi:alpha-tubulin suppressor-like RCC1 family protein